MARRMSRRQFLNAAGLIVGSSAFGTVGSWSPIPSWFELALAKSRSRSSRRGTSSQRVLAQFTQDMPLPPAAREVKPFEFQCDLPSRLELETPRFYEVGIRRNVAELIPGVETDIWGYDGILPGPTFRVRHNEPAIVRFRNDLDVDTITHNHGGHQAAESDGSPSESGFLIRPGQFYDYCYPNIAPVDPLTGLQDTNDFASTQWYHDHAPDNTGESVYRGLAGFYLLTDALEEKLIADHILPSEPYDIPLVVQDKVLDREGQLVYRPGEDNFDGWLGNVHLVNGKAQPRLQVQRRKYRFRLLNGSNARFYEFKLSSGQFCQIGKDSWLLPTALVPSSQGRRNRIQLAPAERADVIIDFSQTPAGQDIFLENILEQDDGRGPDDNVRGSGTPLLKFQVEGEVVPNDVTIKEGDPLRPHTPIRREEIVRTRRFEFERRHGRWVINDEFFDPNRDDADPELGTAERWLIKNGGGGWSHPLHIHLEAHQIQRISRRRLDPQERFKSDTVRLAPNSEGEVFMKFRTFPGRFVFHCHNLEHEDMAMMGIFKVRG